MDLSRLSGWPVSSRPVSVRPVSRSFIGCLAGFAAAWFVAARFVGAGFVAPDSSGNCCREGVIVKSLLAPYRRISERTLGVRRRKSCFGVLQNRRGLRGKFWNRCAPPICELQNLRLTLAVYGIVESDSLWANIVARRWDDPLFKFRNWHLALEIVAFWRRDVRILRAKG